MVDSEGDDHALVPWIPGCAEEDEQEWGTDGWKGGVGEFDEWDDEWKDAGMEFVRQLTEREDSDLAENCHGPAGGEKDLSVQRERSEQVAKSGSRCLEADESKPAQTGEAAASSRSTDGAAGGDILDGTQTDGGAAGPQPAPAGGRASTHPEQLTEAQTQAAGMGAAAAATAAAQLQQAAGGPPHTGGNAANGGDGQAPATQTTFRIKVWQDESKYIGEWVGDRMNGVGEMRWADGRRYIGEWLDNRCHGRGVLTYQDGRRYEGEYTADMMHGKGEYHWSEGARYVGEYREHKKHGRGVMTWKTGGRYDGDYVDDKMTGHGMMTWADGRRYEGQWHEGRCTGMGTTSFKSGSRYVGSYSCDKMEGRGCYTFADGRRYEGEYKSNQKHGRGVYKWQNGLLFSGTWVKGAPKQGVLLFKGGACARTVAARSDLCPDMALQKLQDEARSWLDKEIGGGGQAFTSPGDDAVQTREEGQQSQASEETGASGEEGRKKNAGWMVRRADAKADKGEGADGKKEGGALWSLQALLRSTWNKRRPSVDGREEAGHGADNKARGAAGGRRGALAGQWWRPRLVKEDELTPGEDWLELKEGELWHLFVGHEEEGGSGPSNETFGGSRLIEAAGRGLLDVVMWFVNASWAHATYVAPDGRTPLHAACQGCHVQVASFLLAMGADPGAMDSEERRCLWCACASGDAALARLVAGACSEDDVVVATNDLFELVAAQGTADETDEAASSRGAAKEAVLEVWRRWSGSEGLLDALCRKDGIESALVDAARSSREDTCSAAGRLMLAVGQRGPMCLSLLSAALTRVESQPSSATLAGQGEALGCVDELVQGMRRLELSGADITEVAESVGLLTNLTELCVKDTVVQRLPDQISHLRRLRKLTIRSGCLSCLPEDLAQLKELTTLDASSNLLSSLPSSLASMPLLSTVDLSRNRLRALPAGLGSLLSLCMLSVEDNSLHEWPLDIVQCSSLTRLDAGGNEGLGLPPSADRLSSLRFLSLAGNKLTNLSGSASNFNGATPESGADVALPEKSLRELNLSHNRFERLPDAVVRCRALERLWLSHNELTALPAALADTRGLRTLHVDHNRIRLLPPSLSRTALMGTYDLRVEGNDMRHPMRLDSKLDCPVEELLGYCASLERGRERMMQATVVVDGPSKTHTKLSVIDCFLSPCGARRDQGNSFQALRTWVADKTRKDDGRGRLEPVLVEHSRLQQAVDGESVDLQFLAVSGSREGAHEVMREELVPGRSVLCFVWETKTPLFEVLASAREALSRFLQQRGRKRGGWSSEMSMMLVCVAGQHKGAGPGASSQPAEVLRFFAEHADTAPAAARHTRGAAAAAAFDQVCGQNAARPRGLDVPATFKIKGFLTVDASLKNCAWVPLPGQQGGVRGVRPGEVLERFARMGRDAAVGDCAFPEAMAPQGLINSIEIISEMAQLRRESSEAPGWKEREQSCSGRLVEKSILRAVVEDQCGLAWDEYGAEVMTILKSRGTALMLGGAAQVASDTAGEEPGEKVLLGAHWVGLAAGLTLGLGLMSQTQSWHTLVKSGRELMRTAGWPAPGTQRREEMKWLELCVQRLDEADPEGGMLCKGVLVEGVGEALFGTATGGGGAWGAGMPGWEVVGAVLSSFGVLIREEVSKSYLVPSLCTNSIPYPLEWVRSTGAEGRREWIAWRRAEVVGEARKHACFQVMARLARRGGARLVLWRDGGLLTLHGGKLILDGGSEVGVLWLRGAGEDGVAEELVQTGLDEMRKLGLTAATDEVATNSSDAQADLSLAAHRALQELDDEGSSQDGREPAEAAESEQTQGEEFVSSGAAAPPVDAASADDESHAAARDIEAGSEDGKGEREPAAQTDSGAEEAECRDRSLEEGQAASDEQPVGKVEGGSSLLGGSEDGPCLDIGPGPHPAGCGPTEQASSV